jgi:hypothetical protein
MFLSAKYSNKYHFPNENVLQIFTTPWKVNRLPVEIETLSSRILMNLTKEPSFQFTYSSCGPIWFKLEFLCLAWSWSWEYWCNCCVLMFSYGLHVKIHIILYDLCHGHDFKLQCNQYGQCYVENVMFWYVSLYLCPKMASKSTVSYVSHMDWKQWKLYFKFWRV